jgi:hypothetical protein
MTADCHDFVQFRASQTEPGPKHIITTFRLSWVERAVTDHHSVQAGGGVDADGYERDLLQALRARLLPPRTLKDTRTRGDVMAEDVRVEDRFPSSTLVVILRESTRTACRFGFRARIWTERGESRGTVARFREPDEFAMILSTHLEETVSTGPGLPATCAPGEITWVHVNPLWRFWE